MGFLVLPGDVLNAPKPERWQPVPGDYVLAVDEAKEESYTNSKTGEQGSRLSLACKIQSGPGLMTSDNGKTIYHTLFLTGGDDKAMRNNMGQLRVFLEAVGLIDHVQANGGQIDADWFVGRQFACHIVIKKDFPRVSDERPVGTPSTRGKAGAPPPQQNRAAVAQPSMLGPVGAAAPAAMPPTMPGMMQPPPQAQAAPTGQPVWDGRQWVLPQAQFMPAYPPSPPQMGAVAVPPPPPGYGVPLK